MRQREAIQGSAQFKQRHFRKQQPLPEHLNFSVNWETYILRILNGLQELNSLGGLMDLLHSAFATKSFHFLWGNKNQPPLTLRQQSKFPKPCPTTSGAWLRVPWSQGAMSPAQSRSCGVTVILAHVTAAHLAQENPLEPWTHTGTQPSCDGKPGRLSSCVSFAWN